MAETTTPTTTRPARKRAPAKTATPKAATPAKVAEVAPETVEPKATQERFGFAMDSGGDTKTYSKWTPPAGSGCVGTLYVPLGAVEVKVLVIGPTA